MVLREKIIWTPQRSPCKDMLCFHLIKKTWLGVEIKPKRVPIPMNVGETVCFKICPYEQKKKTLSKTA